MCHLHSRTLIPVHHALCRVETERMLQLPLARPGKTRCLGGSEQLVSWECPAESTGNSTGTSVLGKELVVRPFPRVWITLVGLGEHEGPRQRCKTWQIHIRTRGVCVDGEEVHYPEAFLRGLFILCAPRLVGSLNVNSWKGPGEPLSRPGEYLARR